MRRERRRFLLLAAVPLAGMVVAAACGFPNPPIAGDDAATMPDDGSDGSDANSDTNSDATDAPSTPDVAPDVQPFDGNAPDVFTGDAGSKIDASGCDTKTNCDCDGDGYHHATVGGGKECDASAAKKNVDCDDYDSRVHPNQEHLDIPGEPPRWGDWDCSGEIDWAYPPNVQCAKLNLQLGQTCKDFQGYRDQPDCGATTNSYVKCTAAVIGLACEEGSFEIRKQACK